MSGVLVIVFPDDGQDYDEQMSEIEGHLTLPEGATITRLVLKDASRAPIGAEEWESVPTHKTGIMV